MTFETIKNSTLQFLPDHTKKLKIILGLSGGPDSIFLFFILKALHDEQKITLMAAHLDHGWRPDSENDVLFCKKLCEQYTISFISSHIKDLNITPKYNGSQEELGRIYRQYFFKTLVKTHQSDLVALAHHQQDQQETFFLRLLRGSSLSGLACMKAIDTIYFRPLLQTSKHAMLAWLDDNNVAYLQDPTNTSDQYLRNRIRNYVIPALKQCDQRFDQTFQNTLTHIKHEHALLEKLTQKTFQNTFVLLNEAWHGSLASLKGLDRPLQKRVLIHWLIQENVPFCLSNAFIEEIMRFLLSTQGGAHQLKTTWQIKKKKNSFWICQQNI